MDRVQLPQDYRATTRKQLVSTILSLGVPGINVIDPEAWKYEPSVGFETRTPELVIPWHWSTFNLSTNIVRNM